MATNGNRRSVIVECRRYTTAVVVVVSCVVFGVVILIWAKPADLSLEPDATLIQQKDYWLARISAIGGKAAYSEFAQYAANLPTNLIHSASHAFGGALFETEGVSSLAICDDRFFYGCFHEFVGRAIAANGLSIIPLLGNSCVKMIPSNPFPCFHGIGHGIISHVGYEHASLLTSLDMCNDLAYGVPFEGCFGGVFMEYNLRTMADGKIRPSFGDMQYPCNSIPNAYREACYYRQPQFWYSVLKTSSSSTDSIFRQLGSLCDKANNISSIRYCFEGIGDLVAFVAEFDPQRITALCESTSSNPQRQLFCKSKGAYMLFVSSKGKKSNGHAVCEGLTGAYLTYCDGYAKGTINNRNRVQPPDG